MAALDPGISTRQGRALAAALDRFVERAPGRSIAMAATGEVDVHDGRGHDVVRPAASLMKLPIVMAVLRAGSTGRIGLTEPVRFDEFPPSALPALTDVLDRSHVVTIRELCGLALVTSDNALAQYLLERVGAGPVEKLLAEIGCPATALPVGFSDDDLRDHPRDNVSTAADMIRVLGLVLESDEMGPACLAIERTSKLSRIPLLVRSEGAVRTGHKTGSLVGVCNDVGFVAHDQVVLRVAVLCDGEADVTRCGIEIAECVATVWNTLTGSGE